MGVRKDMICGLSNFGYPCSRSDIPSGSLASTRKSCRHSLPSIHSAVHVLGKHLCAGELITVRHKLIEVDIVME